MGNTANSNADFNKDGFYKASVSPDKADIDDILDEISDEINAQYDSKPSVADSTSRHAAYVAVSAQLHAATHKYAHIPLDFVAKQNYVEKISAVFAYQKQLGCGASCRVLLVNDIQNEQKQYALKEMMMEDPVNRLLFANEYKVLQQLTGHRHILPYHNAYIDRNCYYLSTQYCSGGTMLDRIIQQGHFNEHECSEFMKDVLLGIQYMHRNKIVHRDIKCQNLVFDKLGKDGIVKIIDFGNSEIVQDPNEPDRVIVGSLHYLAPQLLSDINGPRTKSTLYSCDMWAVGVVCYILVSGKVPFFGNDQAETLQSIRRGQYVWPSAVQLSESCKDFISRLLLMDANQRMTADQALQHEWISQKDVAPTTDFGDSYLNQIQVFSRANKLQKILINAILSEMDKKEKRILLKAIRDLDMDGTGQINESDVINFILLHGSFGDAQQAQKSAHKFMSNVRQYGVCASSPNSETNTRDTQKLSGSVFDHIDVEEIDVGQLLDELDEEDEKETQIEIIVSPPKEIKQTNAPQTKQQFDMLDESDDEDLDDDDEDEANDEEEVENRISMINNFRRKGDELDLPETEMQTKMSVERFSQIMEKAEKLYDVKSLVQRLEPTASGNIPLQNITEFKGALHSEMSNKETLDAMIELGFGVVDEPSASTPAGHGYSNSSVKSGHVVTSVD